MCGIVGYIGNSPASSKLLSGLKRLEYRGYDSSGIALKNDGAIEVFKKEGKIANLEEYLKGLDLRGCVGIGHTRWATHGKPSDENAHPHGGENIQIVHNGIIENYKEIKKKLLEKGYVFASETDSEVIAHLIDSYRKESKGLFEAVCAALSELAGAFAIAAISSSDDKLIAARKGSPLVLGLGEGENFVASDPSALLSFTKRVVYLEDGEMAEIDKDGWRVADFAGKNLKKEVKTISWDPIAIEKAGYRHFMLKEIFEQPEAVLNTVVGMIDFESENVDLADLKITEKEIRDLRLIHIIACGTSWHAALIGKYYLEEFARVNVNVEVASEFRYRNPVLDKADLAMFISQSGETADTLFSMRDAKGKGIKTLAVVNVQESTIARESDGVFYTHAGPEIGVASTKAFTTQVVSLLAISLYFGRIRGFLEKERERRIIKEIIQFPEKLKMILSEEGKIKKIAKSLFQASDFLFLGRGLQYPIALEGALKLKEISYIHAEGYAAGEMKHGPIALIDEKMPVVMSALKDKNYEKVKSNIEEIKARGGITVVLSTKGDEEIGDISDYKIELPEVAEELSPLATIVPLQLLSYHIAVLKGTDVDQPRNLAKSVTVE